MDRPCDTTSVCHGAIDTSHFAQGDCRDTRLAVGKRGNRVRNSRGEVNVLVCFCIQFRVFQRVAKYANGAEIIMSKEAQMDED